MIRIQSLKIFRSAVLKFWLLPALLFFVASCEKSTDIPEGDGQVYLQLRSTPISKDPGENHVKTIRIMAFKLGSIVYNDFLTFPDDDLTKLAEPIGLYPGTYDLLFVANESDYEGLTAALKEVTTISDFNTNPVFQQLAYEWGYKPENKPFLMSAYYSGITLTKEHIKDNPLLKPVSLVRAFAKVELVFTNNQQLEAGEASKEVEKVVFNNIPQYFTLPGATFKIPTHTGTLSKHEIEIKLGDNFYSKPGATETLTFYLPEFLRQPGEGTTLPILVDIVGKDGGDNPINSRLFLQMPTDNSTVWSKIDEMAIPKLDSELINPISVIRNSNYRANVNVTERGLDVFIYFWIGYYEDPIFVDGDSAPGIVNIDRREVYLDLVDNPGEAPMYKGEIFFNFGGADYMEFVMASKTNDINDEGFGFKPVEIGNVYKLNLEFDSQTAEQGYLYLKFKNTRTASDSMISIKIKLIKNE